MAAVEVRTFAARDAAAVAALWRTVFPDGDHGGTRAPEAIIARRREVQPELFLVAIVDGSVVGTTLAGYDGHRGWLYRVAVAPDRRRGGVGRALLREAERRLRALGCTKVNLQIESENGAVAGFYERLGFAVEPRISMGKRLLS